MKTLVSLLFFTAFSLTISAQAKINFDNTTVVYQHVKIGSDGTRTFNFKNTGNKPLVIKKVTSTSEHLKASGPNSSIAPGKTGKITVTYDTKIEGPVRRTVTVYSNAKNTPIQALKVKGYVGENKQ